LFAIDEVGSTLHADRRSPARPARILPSRPRYVQPRRSCRRCRRLM